MKAEIEPSRDVSENEHQMTTNNPMVAKKVPVVDIQDLRNLNSDAGPHIKDCIRREADKQCDKNDDNADKCQTNKTKKSMHRNSFKVTLPNKRKLRRSLSDVIRKITSQKRSLPSKSVDSAFTSEHRCNKTLTSSPKHEEPEGNIFNRLKDMQPDVTKKVNPGVGIPHVPSQQSPSPRDLDKHFSDIRTLHYEKASSLLNINSSANRGTKVNLSARFLEGRLTDENQNHTVAELTPPPPVHRTCISESRNGFTRIRDRHSASWSNPTDCGDRDGEETHLGAAVSALMICVELLACLDPTKAGSS